MSFLYSACYNHMHTSGKVFITEIPMNSEWQAAYFSVLSMESNITFIPFGLIHFLAYQTVVKLSSSCPSAISELAHCEGLYLGVLVWDRPNVLCL